MATILGIGIATIDIINTVREYPEENAEVRAVSQHRARGGNASNSLSVLADLGHDCQWAGTLVDDADGDFVRAALDRSGVGYRHCQILDRGTMPTSYILLSSNNGSRTIVHYRDLPEFNPQECHNLPWHDYAWLHFEGRNVLQTRQLLKNLRAGGYPGRISIEIEKPREAISSLYEFADVLMFSRHFAVHQGFDDGATFLGGIRELAGPRATLVCAWGEMGAYGLATDGSAHYSPAFPPPRVLDTLGAGDVFNAGLIHACLNNLSLAAALEQACRLAGKKCGQIGMHDLIGTES